MPPVRPDGASDDRVTPLPPTTNAAPPPPRFTFIVATYNYGRYLARGIDSILAQDGDDFEIIVVDDGSTDDTRAIVAGYAPHVRYIRQEHAGPFDACREAYHAMHGRWAVFVGADDRLRPGALAALRAAADDQPHVRFVMGGNHSVDEQGRETSRPWFPPALPADPLERFAGLVRGRWSVCISGGLIDRALLAPFDRPAGFEYPHGMDRAVVALAMLHPVARVDFVTLEVHDHPGRLRDNIASIHRSGLRLADVLFDPAVLPPQVLVHRRSFVAFIERERARAYFRAGWHGPAWRSYAAAVRAEPSSMMSLRHLRRALGSAARSLLRRPEGPVAALPANVLWGHQRAIWADPVGFLDAANRHDRAAALLRLQRRTYLLREPADARHVLVANDRNYMKSGILMAFSLLAGGMIGMQRPAHPTHRRVVQPTLQKRSVQGYAPLMIDIIGRRVASWSPSERFDAAIEFKWMTGDVSSAAVFDCRDSTKAAELVELVRMSHQCAARELKRWPPVPRWLPIKRRRMAKRLLREIDAWLDPWVSRATARASQADKSGPPDGKQSGDDMLSLMLRGWAEPGPPTAAAMRDRLMTLFTAGFEPVAVVLSWAAQLLAERPDVQDALAVEAASVWGGRSITPEDLARLPLTGRVVDEVLRLYPSEPLLTRRALVDDRLPSGVRVRKGEEVMVSPRLFQHDARFFPDPERFDPDRFAGPPTWPADAMIPFGMGPRVCIGEYFARMEMMLAITMIVSRWRLEAGPGPRPEIEMPNLFSSQPRAGHLYVRLARRANPHDNASAQAH
ncbi:MAG: cytochrome P450 [Planctomycetota bacterium]|nr:cytochrome P450 [Planctomycetota bacterium]